MGFGHLPQWFFIAAISFVIAFVIIAEWKTRK